MARVMLIIATGQNAANIQPLSEATLRPDIVCIAVTEGMKDQLAPLKEQIKALGLGIDVEDPLYLPNELDVGALENSFSTWLLEQHAGDEVLINLNGGLKTITVAAYKVFSALGARIFYGHKDGQVVWLDQPLASAMHLNPNIKLPAYLRIYQYEIADRQALSDIDNTYKNYAREMLNYLRHDFNQRCHAISQLNWLAKPVIDSVNTYERQQKNQKAVSLPVLRVEKPQYNHTLQELYQAIPHIEQVFTLSSAKLHFTSMESARVVAGGWLDILVADSLRSLCRDVSLNVSFSKSTQRQGKSTYNELDVMALAGTQLLIVECKTVNWQSSNETSPLEAIYKLAALSDLGGLNTRTLFVSLYDLPSTALTRAAENNIEVIAGKRLLELSSVLQRWIGQT